MGCMSKRALALAGALSAGLIFAETSKADVIAQYTFAGSSLASSDAEGNSGANNVSAGGGTSSQFNNSVGNPGPSYAIFANTETTEGTAVSNGDFIEFKVTPGANYELDLTSLTFDLLKFSNASANKFFVRSSLDGYGSTIGSGTITNISNKTPPDAFESKTVSLTGPSFQNLAADITFRIYSYGATNASRSLFHDNVILNGSVVAIPEPATFGLMGVSALLLAIRRRRRESAI